MEVHARPRYSNPLFGRRDWPWRNRKSVAQGSPPTLLWEVHAVEGARDINEFGGWRLADEPERATLTGGHARADERREALDLRFAG